MTQALTEKNPRRGLLRFLLRLPILFYRLHLGWLLGNRFLLLKHIGRKSGLTRETVLEVLRYDKQSKTYIVASGWGEGAQWYRNIVANPSVEIKSGWRRMRAKARRVSHEEAERELRAYAERHPIAYRAIVSRLLGERVRGEGEEIRALAERVPVIAIRGEEGDAKM